MCKLQVGAGHEGLLGSQVLVSRLVSSQWVSPGITGGWKPVPLVMFSEDEIRRGQDGV